MKRIILVAGLAATALIATGCCTSHQKAQAQGAPVVAPTTEVTAASSIETTNEAEIPLFKEEMVVGKKEVSNGGVLIRTTVKTEDVSQPVELQREEYVIERVPASEAVGKTTATAFQGREIYIPLTREEPMAMKRTWLTEKVQLGKRVEIDKQTVSSPVRSEDVEITKSAGKASTGTIWGEPASVAAAPTEPNALHLAKEELIVGKTQVDNGGVNVKKIVHTQTASQPIELQREEYTLDRSPLAEHKLASTDFTQKEVRLNLTREAPVVSTRIQPTEYVRVRKHIETDKQVVSGQIRSEGIEVVKLAANEAAMGGTGTAGQSGFTTISESSGTLNGKALCGKCQLHLTETCQPVIQAEKDGKTVNYYVVKNDVTKSFKENLCKEAKMVTATGSVAEVAGKLEFTPTEIKLQ